MTSNLVNALAKGEKAQEILREIHNSMLRSPSPEDLMQDIDAAIDEWDEYIENQWEGTREDKDAALLREEGE